MAPIMLHSAMPVANRSHLLGEVGILVLVLKYAVNVPWSADPHGACTWWRGTFRSSLRSHATASDVGDSNEASLTSRPPGCARPRGRWRRAGAAWPGCGDGSRRSVWSPPPTDWGRRRPGRSERPAWARSWTWRVRRLASRWTDCSGDLSPTWTADIVPLRLLAVQTYIPQYR